MICFGRATVDAGWSGSNSLPVFSRLYYIINGSFSITGSDGTCLKLQKGKWYLIPSGYSFTYKCNETMEHLYVHIKMCDFDGIDLLNSCYYPLCIENKNYTPDSIIDIINSNCIIDGIFLKQYITSILLLFIKEYQISINADDYSAPVFRAITYIRQNLSAQLTISEIAKNIFVSKSTLTKHFRKELEMSVNKYICNTIMTEAERLLTTTEISISDISQRLGFSDQFYFSRCFKKIFGKPPREYRNRRALY